MYQRPAQRNIIGQSAPLLSVLEQVSRLAPIHRPVLIVGERGTGKELIARRLHYLSPRWDQPFISLNCAALTEGLIDTELFGHESGSFTGATKRHQGRFERAEKGSLFLDELTTAPDAVQQKLLRIVEYGTYERVGGSATLTADVRLICATNENLPKMAEHNQFRADLLDRLAFDVITLPPLRERLDDILILAEHFAIKMCQELGFSYFPGFSSRINQQLLEYPWPGNIRQLKNVVERAVYLHQSSSVPIDTLIFDPFIRQTTPPTHSKDTLSSTSAISALPLDLKQWLDDQEQKFVITALEQSKYHQKSAAQMLGLSYHQLRGLIKKYQINTKNNV